MSWTDRFVSPAGAGANTGVDAANAFTLAQAITDAATPHTDYRYNIIAGTYANTSTGRTFSGAGTTTAPIWWRGYKTTIGDLDDGVTLPRSLQDGVNLPLITFTTGQMVVSGANQIFSNLDITSACTTSAGAVSVTGGTAKFINCRIENTAANANSRAISFTGAGTYNWAAGCRFKATTTADACVRCGIQMNVFSCHVIGGIDGLQSGSVLIAIENVIEGFATNGINESNAAGIQIVFNTIYAASTNCILNSAVQTLPSLVANNILGGCTNGYNNSSGASTNSILLFNNHFYSVTNNLVNVTEIAAFSDDLGVLCRLKDNDNDPFIAKAAHNYALLPAAFDRLTGFPGVFEGQTLMTGYHDIGAVQHLDRASGMFPGLMG